MMDKYAGLFIGATIGLFSVSSSYAGSTNPHNSDQFIQQQNSNAFDESNIYDPTPNGKGQANWQGAPRARMKSTWYNSVVGSALAQYGISYHGGPVLGAVLDSTGKKTVPTPPNVYIIYYGNFTSSSAPAEVKGAPAIINTFLSSWGGTPYYNILSTFTNSLGNVIPNAINLTSTINDNYSLGSSKLNLTDANIQSIVTNAIGGKKLPLDPNGIYLVVTSPDIGETSGFCTNYCGWHTYTRYGNTPIQFAFIGDSKRCPGACEAQGVSPNNNPSADGMLSVITHEIAETVTDPQLNAWYDSTGAENGDKCAWNFGAVQKASNGSYYNLVINNNKYLLQQEWLNVSPSGMCGMSFSGAQCSAAH